jgi:hypothetical protein
MKRFSYVNRNFWRLVVKKNLFISRNIFLAVQIRQVLRSMLWTASNLGASGYRLE